MASTNVMSLACNGEDEYMGMYHFENTVFVRICVELLS